MASTDLGRRLTEGHRLAQVRVSARTIQLMMPLWRILDFAGTNVGNVDEWLVAVGALLSGQHRVSAELSRAYYRVFRAAEIGDAGLLAAAAVPVLPAAQVEASMMATGPARYRSAFLKGATTGEASGRAAVAAARAAARLALQGGRQTQLFSVTSDERALGWSRVGGSKPCAFCAVLIGRGPVYKTEESAEFEAHDGCNCGSEAVFRRDQPWPPGARDIHSLYRSATRGEPDPINAFRRAWEARN